MTDIKLWHEIEISPPKGETRKLTEKSYHKYLAMRDELIDQQRVEIQKLKMKINKLEQRLGNGKQ